MEKLTIKFVIFSVLLFILINIAPNFQNVSLIIRKIIVCPIG